MWYIFRSMGINCDAQCTQMNHCHVGWLGSHAVYMCGEFSTVLNHPLILFDNNLSEWLMYMKRIFGMYAHTEHARAHARTHTHTHTHRVTHTYISNICLAIHLFVVIEWLEIMTSSQGHTTHSAQHRLLLYNNGIIITVQQWYNYKACTYFWN